MASGNKRSPRSPSPTKHQAATRDPETISWSLVKIFVKDIAALTLLPAVAMPTVKMLQTWNRNAINFPNDPIIPKVTIEQYKREVESLPTHAQANAFKQKIYGDPSYCEHMRKPNSTKPLVCGSGACHWKNGKEWKCNSLHFSFNVYMAMGKKEWSDNGSHGRQPAAPRDPCNALTKVGNTKCKRKCCHNSRFCTQHTKRYPFKQ